MVGRLGTHADILMTESVLGRILETMDSMLLDSDNAAVFLTGDECTDEDGRYFVVKGISDKDGLGLCLASSEGGTEPTESDISLFKRNVGTGIMMKVDVFSHQFSLYRIDDEIADATVLFTE